MNLFISLSSQSSQISVLLTSATTWAALEWLLLETNSFLYKCLVDRFDRQLLKLGNSKVYSVKMSHSKGIIYWRSTLPLVKPITGPRRRYTSRGWVGLEISRKKGKRMLIRRFSTYHRQKKWGQAGSIFWVGVIGESPWRSMKGYKWANLCQFARLLLVVPPDPQCQEQPLARLSASRGLIQSDFSAPQSPLPLPLE